MKEAQTRTQETAPMEWGSDAMAELLRRLGLEYVALNPGASYRGLHDSIVNYLGNKDPQIILCLHEEHAVAIAHGYSKVTGRPMGVILHSNVGLMHASMAIYCAWCNRAPVIIIGATGPIDATIRRPWIDWIHTSQDQGALVRYFTKWDDQPGSVSAALESLLRASLIAQTPPKGPVYVCLDVALQESRLGHPVPIPDINRFMPPGPVWPSPKEVRAAADSLLKASKPLILAGRVSRDKEDWNRRVELAETLGASVLTDVKTAASFPTNHPLHPVDPGIFISKEAARLIREADAILSLDWMDLAGTLKQAWGDDPVKAKVIHCSLDTYNHRGWSMDYFGLPPLDILLLSDPDILVKSLLEIIAGTNDNKTPGRNSKGWFKPKKTIVETGICTSGEIRLRDIASCLKQFKNEHQICLTGLPLRWPEGIYDYTGPFDYLGKDGGGGVGSGPGIAVGAAMALKNSGRVPVAILGDGDYLMGVNALWTAAHYRIPLLIIVANNRSYHNCEIHQLKTAQKRDRPVENRGIGQRISDPPVDIAGIARAQGLDAQGPVTHADALPSALKRGLEAAEEGKCYVVDVIFEPD